MTLTNEQRRSKHQEFMNSNWRALAAFSWEHYLADGRGIVVLPEEDFIHADHPQYALLRFRYALADSPELKDTPDREGGKEHGWLKTYDPKLSVIVMILLESGSASSYLIGGKLPPPNCSAVKKSEQN